MNCEKLTKEYPCLPKLCLTLVDSRDQSCLTTILLRLSLMPSMDVASPKYSSTAGSKLELLRVESVALLLLFCQIIVRMPFSVSPGIEGRSSNGCSSAMPFLNSVLRNEYEGRFCRTRRLEPLMTNRERKAEKHATTMATFGSKY